MHGGYVSTSPHHWPLVFQKMRETPHFRKQMLDDPQQLTDILQMFPHFLDTKRLVGNNWTLETFVKTFFSDSSPFLFVRFCRTSRWCLEQRLLPGSWKNGTPVLKTMSSKRPGPSKRHLSWKNSWHLPWMKDLTLLTSQVGIISCQNKYPQLADENVDVWYFPKEILN